eukprot:3776606-Pleurochrysis_carterae.AAC.2
MSCVGGYSVRSPVALPRLCFALGVGGPPGVLCPRGRRCLFRIVRVPLTFTTEILPMGYGAATGCYTRSVPPEPPQRRRSKVMRGPSWSSRPTF